MFKTSLFLVCVAAAAAQTSGLETGTVVMGGSATLESGTFFEFKAVLRPAGTPQAGLGAGGIYQSGDTVHRYMVDLSTGSYFGYDVAIGQPDAAGASQATFQPLSHVERIDGSAGLKLIQLPKYPPPQTLHDGDVMEIDLMTSPDGARRLTDVISIRSREPRPAGRTTAMPRDFTVDDGPVTFDTTSYTFWKQGQQQNSTGFTAKPGKTLWITIPGRGRYILSLAPHQGFTKSGAIRDNVASFEDAGQQYELRFPSPIAGAGKAWNLYVMRESSYVANQNPAFVHIGTDRLENLVAGH